MTGLLVVAVGVALVAVGLLLVLGPWALVGVGVVLVVAGLLVPWEELTSAESAQSPPRW